MENENRLNNVLEAIAIGTIDAPQPDDFALELFQEFIDGKISLDEMEHAMLSKYREEVGA